MNVIYTSGFSNKCSPETNWWQHRCWKES